MIKYVAVPFVVMFFILILLSINSLSYMFNDTQLLILRMSILVLFISVFVIYFALGE